MPKLLSAESVAQYHRDGFHFPLRVMTAAEAGDYRRRADQAAYDIVARKQAEVLGRTEPFTIETPADTKYVRRVRIESKLLTEFWGRPMHLGAIVLVPSVMLFARAC